jgi:GT2 family glycosyltransferase
MHEPTTRQTSASAIESPQLPVSLIICSRNRPELLAESVDSILQGDQIPAELIIVDQSDAPHATLAARPDKGGCDLRYLWTHSVGLSRANNLGIATASHSLLVFTHDDVLVSREWLGTIVDALRTAGPGAVVTGQVRPVAQTQGGFAPATRVDETPTIYQGRLDHDILYPLNMAMYRSTVDEVGGFDERLGPGTPFPGAEDSDFGFRLLEAGYQIHYVPQAIVYHRAWRAARDFLPLRWGYGHARGAFYAKYISLRDRYMLKRMTRDVAVHIVLFVRRLRHERQRACGDAVLAAGILVGASKWLLIQRKTV